VTSAAYRVIDSSSLCLRTWRLN